MIKSATPEVMVGSTSHVTLHSSTFEENQTKLQALVSAMAEKGMYLSEESITRFVFLWMQQHKKEMDMREVFSSYGTIPPSPLSSRKG